MQVISGKPYSARQVTEHVHTLADRTNITQPPDTELLYRDSAGRTRTERPIGPSNLAGQYVIVEICDPVAQVQYTLDPVSKVAHRVVMRLQSPGESGSGGGGGIQEEREDLGTKEMEGVVVHGTKFTATVPAGAQGNDRPLVTVREQWVAPGLGLTVLNHILDPRNGETTVKLTNISTTGHDPTLFMPPADYSVVEETGEFQFNVYPQPKEKQ